MLDKIPPIDTDIFPLQTPASLAARWGVGRSRVQKWKERHKDFPQPIKGYVDGSSSYYPMFAVRDYEQERGLDVNDVAFVNDNNRKKGVQ